MNPLKLVREGGGEAVAQACGKCGRVYELGSALAAQCCDPRCSECGEPAERFRTHCKACWAKRETQREADRASKATRISEADYSGPVYFEGAWNDGYLRDTDEFHEWWENDHEESEPAPSEVWACTVRRINIPNAERMIEEATEDAYDGAEDDMPPTADLQAAIDAYNASVTAEVWEADFSRLVVLAPVAEPSHD